MSSKTVTSSVRYKLDNLRTNKQSERRTRIHVHLIPLAEMVMENNNSTNIKYDTKSGMLTFKYKGRRVVYWVGAEKMIVSSRGIYTLYDSFTVDDFVLALMRDDPTDFNAGS